MSETVAIIPARAGSKRVPNKNIRLLAGHPLIAYSIRAVQDSGVFERVVVSTDSAEIARIAESYGAEVPGLRPAEFAGDSSHDIGFLRDAMDRWVKGNDDQLWGIVRPTSPLRSGSTLRDAFTHLCDSPWADSIRALRPVTEHPGKMWRVDPVTGEASTFIDQGGAFNGPITELEKLYVQASSFEIVRRGAVLEHNSIAGKRVLAYFMPEHESIDVNSEEDWSTLERAISEKPDLLPRLGVQ